MPGPLFLNFIGQFLCCLIPLLYFPFMIFIPLPPYVQPILAILLCYSLPHYIPDSMD